MHTIPITRAKFHSASFLRYMYEHFLETPFPPLILTSLESASVQQNNVLLNEPSMMVQHNCVCS